MKIEYGVKGATYLTLLASLAYQATTCNFCNWKQVGLDGYGINKITFKRTWSLSNAVCFKYVKYLTCLLYTSPSPRD